MTCRDSARRSTVPLLLFCGLLAACDEKKEAPSTPEAAAPPPQTATPPPAPTPPLVTVDSKAVMVTGDKVDLSAGDASGRLAALLATRPKVEGEVLELDALRDATMANVAAAIGGIKAAKAKGARVKTARRDQTLGELEVDFDHPAASACSAVAMIGKDSAILVWSAGGGTAVRFSHGMAGPDLTLGTEGLRKLAARCDSNVWYLAADASVKWGLAFDLATVAAGAGDAGPGIRAKHAVVLLKPPVPGRKVAE